MIGLNTPTTHHLASHSVYIADADGELVGVGIPNLVTVDSKGDVRTSVGLGSVFIHKGAVELRTFQHGGVPHYSISVTS